MADYYSNFSVMLDGLNKKELAWCKKRLNELADLDKNDESQVSFNWEAEKNGIWMWSEESFAADHVTTFVQEFLKKFRKNETWGFTWADTCSKPRLDGYGGGAAFVTAKSIRYMNTYEWLNQQEKRAAKKNGRKHVLLKQSK